MSDVIVPVLSTALVNATALPAVRPRTVLTPTAVFFTAGRADGRPLKCCATITGAWFR